MRNRNGIVVLLDMCLLLFFIVAFRGMSNDPVFLVTDNNTFGDPKFLTIAKMSDRTPGGWEVYLANLGWRLIDDADEWKWIAKSVGTACNSICKEQPYGIEDLSRGRIFIGGEMAQTTSFFFYNKCRVTPHACRNIQLTIDGNSVLEGLKVSARIPK